MRIHGGPDDLPGLRRLAQYARQTDLRLLLHQRGGAALPRVCRGIDGAGRRRRSGGGVFISRGSVNVENLARFLADELLMTAFGLRLPVGLPRHGIYHPDCRRKPESPTGSCARCVAADGRHLVLPGHWLSGNLEFVDAPSMRWTSRRQCPAGFHGLAPGNSAESRGNAAAWPGAFDLFYRGDERLIDVLVTTMSFAMADVRDWTHGGVSQRMKPWTCRSCRRLRADRRGPTGWRARVGLVRWTRP